MALVNAHYSVFAAKECAAAGIPFIQTLHNAYVWLDPQAIRRHQQADPHTAAYACVSATAARYADQALGLDAAKMRVLPNGINASRLSPSDYPQNRKRLRAKWQLPDSAPVFLNVASLMASKAQLPLVQAFASVLEQAPEARLVLLGQAMEPAYHRQLKQAVKRLGVTSQVRFAGYHRDPAPHYHAADVFVLPSFWEGWSLSLAEALASGMPAVATQVGAAEDFAGHPGLQLVAPPYGDITELNRQRLHQVLHAEDPAFVQRLAAAMLQAIPAISRASRPLNAEVAERLASRRAYARYASLFQACRMSPFAS